MNADEALQLLERCGIAPGTEPIAQAAAIVAAVDVHRAPQGALVDAHIAHEFAAKDAAATMETMTERPYLFHVPTLAGGEDRDAIHRFYRDDFIPAWPADTAVQPVARTVGDGMVVDELIVSFTHDREMPVYLPGVAPTGRHVALPHVVVVGITAGKVAFERIYWDQGTLLAQVGLADPATLPVRGVEQARELVRLATRDAAAP